MIGNSPIRVMVVDDHAIIRSGITAFIESQEEFELVSEAENGGEAIALCAKAEPDVILMDLLMPIVDGITATKAISRRYPAISILVLTSNDDDKLVTDAIGAGASGYVLKNGSLKDMAAAIQSVHRGDAYLSPEISQLLMRVVSQRDQPQVGDDLTTREYDVLRLLAQGQSNQQIANALAITPATVKFHVGNILSKLHVASRTAAVALALRRELVES